MLRTIYTVFVSLFLMAYSVSPSVNSEWVDIGESFDFTRDAEGVFHVRENGKLVWSDPIDEYCCWRHFQIHEVSERYLAIQVQDGEPGLFEDEDFIILFDRAQDKNVFRKGFMQFETISQVNDLIYVQAGVDLFNWADTVYDWRAPAVPFLFIFDGQSFERYEFHPFIDYEQYETQLDKFNSYLSMLCDFVEDGFGSDVIDSREDCLSESELLQRAQSQKQDLSKRKKKQLALTR